MRMMHTTSLLRSRRSKSALHAYIYYVELQYPSVDTIAIDERLGPSFLWYALGKIHEARGDYNAAMNVYDVAIEAYKIALQKGYNNLLWQHREQRIYSETLDPFSRYNLPLVVLWSILGEAYMNRGDNVQAIRAFQEARVMQPSNLWLQERITELE